MLHSVKGQVINCSGTICFCKMEEVIFNSPRNMLGFDLVIIFFKVSAFLNFSYWNIDSRLWCSQITQHNAKPWIVYGWKRKNWRETSILQGFSLIKVTEFVCNIFRLGIFQYLLHFISFYKIICLVLSNLDDFL